MPEGDKGIVCPSCGADRGITLLESRDVWLGLPRHRWHFRACDIKAMALLAGYTRALTMPEIGVHPLQSSVRLWMRGHPFWRRGQHWASVDNRVIRLLLFPRGWLLAAIMRPMEMIFASRRG